MITNVEKTYDIDGVTFNGYRMTKNNIIVGGMIPKTQTALDAISDGVRAVVIMDGRVPNACLLELFTDHGAGSMIRA